MFKTIGCLLILGATTYWGFYSSKHFTRRFNELMELERAIYQLEGEIVYTHTPLPEALYNISKKSRQPINNILFEIAEHLYSNKVESVFEAFDKTLKTYGDKTCFNNEDKSVLLDLAKGLGETDVDGQKSIFVLSIENLKRQKKLAEESMTKNCKMYKTLGFSIGAMLVLILI